MINHIIEYFKIPHPLDRDRGSIAVCDPEILSKRCFKVWMDDKKSTGPAELPRALRVLISPDDEPYPEDIDLVKRFERNAEIQENHSWSILKLRIFSRFTFACAIGYFIYWTIFNFPWFWVPATLFLEGILGDTLTKVFQGVVIALVPGLSFIKNFVGAKRWVRINSHSQYIRIYPQLGRSSRDYFAREIKKCLTDLEDLAREEGVFLEIAPIRDILEEILAQRQVRVEFARDWSARFEKLLEQLTQRAKRELFLEGVVIKLDQLRKDLFLHYLNGFQAVPLKVATANLSIEEVDPFGEKSGLSSAILAKGLREKAKNLRRFLEETHPIREEIYFCFDSLKRARGKEERIKLLESIEEGFENLRNICGNYHFGDNPYVPHERGENLSNLYDKLYHLFGEAKIDILEGEKAVRGVFFRRLKIKTERAQKRRIRELMLKAERLLRQGVSTRRGYERISHLFSFFGKDLKRNLAFSALILFSFASLLSFRILSPDQVLTTTYLRWGVKEKATQKTPLFSRGVKVYRFGQGIPIFFQKELFWHLPVPLVFSHKIDFKKPQKFTSYLIFSAPTDTFYKKAMKLLSGPYGGYFNVIELSFYFFPRDKEAWVRYDYDGKGTKRLRRDATSIVEEWRGKLFNIRESPLIDLEDEEEMEKIFSGSYFKKLWNEGRMREIIKSQIFKTPLMTYQYGTYEEMIEPGIDLILRSLEREKTKLRYSELSRREKEKKLAEIDNFKARIEKIKEEALKAAREEYDALRKDPEKLKKYLSDPESISELRGFESVWYAVRRIMLQQYIADKLIKIMKGELGEKKKQELLETLVDKIGKDPYFSSLIEIKEVKAKVIFMDSHGYRSFISKVTEEVI